MKLPLDHLFTNSARLENATSKSFKIILLISPPFAGKLGSDEPSPPPSTLGFLHAEEAGQKGGNAGQSAAMELTATGLSQRWDPEMGAGQAFRREAAGSQGAVRWEGRTALAQEGIFQGAAAPLKGCQGIWTAGYSTFSFSSVWISRTVDNSFRPPHPRGL